MDTSSMVIAMSRTTKPRLPRFAPTARLNRTLEKVYGQFPFFEDKDQLLSYFMDSFQWMELHGGYDDVKDVETYARRVVFGTTDRETIESWYGELNPELGFRIHILSRILMASCWEKVEDVMFRNEGWDLDNYLIQVQVESGEEARVVHAGDFVRGVLRFVTNYLDAFLPEPFTRDYGSPNGYNHYQAYLLNSGFSAAGPGDENSSLAYPVSTFNRLNKDPEFFKLPVEWQLRMVASGSN